MKKSNILLIIAFLGVILLFSIVNMKLKSAYTKKNFHSLLSYTPTARFHHVKEISTNTNGIFPVGWNITIKDTIGFYGVAFDYDFSNQITYKITNDTLYLLTDSAVMNNWSSLYIYTNKLASLQGAKTKMIAVSNSPDSLKIIGSGFADIHFGTSKTKQLLIEGSGQAKINLWGIDEAENAIIKMNDRSSLAIENGLYASKELQIGNEAALSLSGKALRRFGITTKQP
jgi:hypothetical protein